MTSEISLTSRLLACLLAASSVLSGQAAEMRLNVSGTYRSLDIEGRIEPGDYERFLKVAKESQGELSGVNLYSPGGDFLEAIKIGRALRALEMSSNVPMRGRDGRPVCEESLGSKPRDPANCTAASAAFFIHIGGMHRGGTYLAVHRPYFDPKRLKQISQTQAEGAYKLLQQEARAYMNEMALPPHIQEEVLNTPSDKIILLDEKAIRTHIWGDLPYRHEWRRAKCSKMSPSQEMQMQGLSDKIMARVRLTPDESQLLSTLSPLEQQQMRCAIQLTVESRKVAYEKFFGVAPSDITNHNFGKWLDGPKYLGRTFEDVASEERFEPEEDLLRSSSMKRKATSTAPGATVSDVGGRKRFVSWIVMSREDPSPQFLQQLTATLEGAWGKGRGQDPELTWATSKFTAKLTYMKEAARPAVGLIVELPN